MKEYWKILLSYRKYLLLSPFLVLIFVICETIQPTLMANIIDQGVMKNDLAVITETGIIMILFSLLAFAANIGNVFLSSKTSAGFAADLRNSMFHKIQQFSFADIDSLNPSSLIVRITNDVNILQHVLMMSMRLLLRAPMMIVMSFFFVIRISSELAWIVGMAIPVLGILIYALLKKGLPLFILVQQKTDKLNSVVRENLINIRVVKSFVREDFENSKFAISNEDLCQTVIRASNVVITILPLMQLIMNLSIIAIFQSGGRLVVSGNLQVGELISFINYISQILMALMLVSMTVMMFARAAASSQRTLEVLNKKPSLTETAEKTYNSGKIKNGKIEFKNVYFKYNEEGEQFVLHDINFVVEAGEHVAIVGATGASKSTLLQLIPRLYEIRKGEILIDEKDIKNYSLNELRNATGIILQNNELFSGTILSNLQWGKPDASPEEIIEACKIAEAHNFIMSFNDGYNTILGQNGINLSGGQKQRICIARALLKNPRILLMDDSTSSVDTDTEKRIIANLKSIKYSGTIITISQRINTVVSYDKIIVLEDGKITASGKHTELLESSAIYREIYNSQQVVI